MPKKTIFIHLPKLSVSGSGKITVGECGACASTGILGWLEVDLGPICRDCAQVIIQSDLERFFPGSTPRKGGSKS